MLGEMSLLFWMVILISVNYRLFRLLNLQRVLMPFSMDVAIN